MLTKKDIVIMYLLLLTLEEKGFDTKVLLTDEEESRLREVLELNAITKELENNIMLEEFSHLLMKSGVRFGELPEYIH